MCGRFMVTAKRKQIAERFAAQDALPEDITSTTISPSQTAAVVTAETTVHKLEAMRWGIQPSWEPHAARSVLLINARAETLAQKPTFRHLVEAQRCLIPANGFFEWEHLPNGRKRAVCYRLRNRGLFALAGLWEIQHDATGQDVRTFTIITTAANDAVRVVHNRMPVMLTPETEAAWLEPTQPLESLLALLRPYPAQDMTAEDGAPLLALPRDIKQQLLPF